MEDPSNSGEKQSTSSNMVINDSMVHYRDTGKIIPFTDLVWFVLFNNTWSQ